MTKQIIIILALVVVGTLLLVGNNSSLNFNAERSPLSLPNFSLASLKIPFGESETDEAWKTFGSYLEYAKNHDLEGLRSISHQISPTCTNPETESECFELMDSVHAIGTSLTRDLFIHSASDNKQTVIYTDGPGRVFLYFTRGESGELKVLGMRFCQDDPNINFDCSAVNASTVDGDSDGYWDSVESLFYK